ncbi:MAG: hypothetical protein LBB79_06370 [Prevotellaceae bacterium]|jgi:hypothetical protein|nr:hypothetical protein [Prevotellaceae bacterium]
MKRIIFYTLSAATLLLGCRPEDIADVSILFADRNAAEGALRDSMARYEEAYGVGFEWDFFPSDYSPVGFGEALSYTKVTDFGSVPGIVRYIEEKVFRLFPAGFIKEYMPRNVFLVDSLIVTYTYDDEISNVHWTKNIAITGNVTDRYMVLGNIGERFDTAAPGLQEELLSLFIEFLINNPRVPFVPDGVKAATEKAATDVGAVIYSSVNKPNINYPYLDGSVYAKYWQGVGKDTAATPWLGRGILKMGRKGYYAYERSSMIGIELVEFEFHKGTLEQDLADFATFIIFHTPAEREAFYAQVEANTKLYTYDHATDARFPYGGPAGAAAMRTKDAIVKAYLKEHFGIAAE